LTIPHPRISEREFVLRPLSDVHPSYALPLLSDLNVSDARKVLPLPGNRTLPMEGTLIMGILNVTPDSFSDGGVYNTSIKKAVEQAEKMVGEGASIIDVGGESTRPNATPVSLEEELQRTVEIIAALRNSLPPDVAISIDTRRAETARRAVEVGADIVNDVSAGRFDEEMMKTVGELNVPYVMMHSRGTPETMGDLAVYEDLVGEVVGELKESMETARSHNINRWAQILDVGIGFAKTHDHNLSLLKAGSKALSPNLDNIPLLWGASRKGFIGKILGNPPPTERDYGTVGAHLAGVGVESTGCQILRVHEVKGAKDSAAVFDAVRLAEVESIVTNEVKRGRMGDIRDVDPTARKPNKICDPYEQDGKPLTREQATQLLPTLNSDWNFNDDYTSITRMFIVPDFPAGTALLRTLSNVSHNNNHYPKLSLERKLQRMSWDTVVICELRTEVLGGLSYKDFELGLYIDAEVDKIQQ